MNYLPAPVAHCSAGSKVCVQDGSRLHALQLGEDPDQAEQVDLFLDGAQILLNVGTSVLDSAHERRARIGCGPSLQQRSVHTPEKSRDCHDHCNDIFFDFFFCFGYHVFVVFSSTLIF